MGRSFNYGPADKQGQSSHKKSRTSDVVWDLSAVLGRLALGIVCLLAIVVLIRQSPTLKKSLASVLPRAVVHFFEDTAPSAPVIERSRSGAVDRTLEAIGPQPSSTAEPSRRFGIGATKELVSAVQGTPTRRTDGTWYYGQSEVYFAGDRVVGWKIAAGNPLRVR